MELQWVFRTSTAAVGKSSHKKTFNVMSTNCNIRDETVFLVERNILVM